MESLSPADATVTIAALGGSADESALLLLGEHGIGKTHLLEHVHAMPETNSVLIHVHPAEAQFPLAGFASLFAALRHEPASEFHRYFSMRSDEPDGLFAAAHDLLSLIRGLDLPPTVALIDDLDRVDSASRTVLSTIASHLAGTSLWLVGTATDAEQTESVPGFTTAHLLPLTTDEIVEIPTHDSTHDKATLCILADYAGGNPRVLFEQIDRLHNDQLLGAAPLVLPPRGTATVEQLTTKLLDGLSASAREILELVSLAPRAHLAAINTLIPEAADDMEDLIDSGVLKRQAQYVTFTDQRLRCRLYWDQGSKSRREQHGTLAEAYEPLDAGLATWHLSSATRGPQSVDELLGAAISLVTESHVFSAVEFVERAIGRAERLGDHTALIIRLCNRLLSVGQIALADRYSARVRSETTTPQQSMDILNIRLMAQLFHRRHVVDDELLTLADLHAGANPEGASTMLILGAAYRSERWEIDEARRLTNHALRLRHDVSEPTRMKLMAMREILDGLDGLDGVEGTTTNSAEPRTDLDDSSMTSDPDLLLLRARARTIYENYHDARQLFTVVLNHPKSHRGIRKDLATYGTIRNEVGAGQFRMARAAIDVWGGGTPSLAHGTSAFAFLQAWYAYSIGARTEAERLLEKCRELASVEASQALRARALALRGTMRLLNGDPEAAVMDLRQVSAASTRFRNPTLLRHWADYTEACVITGRVQEAAATVTALERRLSAHRSRWGDLALMRCRALVETGRPSLALFDAAVKEFTRDELPYELGRTLRCLAIRQDELGLSVEARRTRMGAVAAFEMSGADSWAAHTDQRAQTGAPGPTGAEGLLEPLSPEEQEVARRVMLGMRNREIAEALFVSVRTVELRLTHVYRALGVRSRAELIAALAGATTATDAPRSDH
jgi:DNA-binding CsgD family transcriptional regulator